MTKCSEVMLPKGQSSVRHFLDYGQRNVRMLCYSCHGNKTDSMTPTVLHVLYRKGVFVSKFIENSSSSFVKWKLSAVIDIKKKLLQARCFVFVLHIWLRVASGDGIDIIASVSISEHSVI